MPSSRSRLRTARWRGCGASCRQVLLADYRSASAQIGFEEDGLIVFVSYRAEAARGEAALHRLEGARNTLLEQVGLPLDRSDLEL